jgi:glycosyltransferase involved in cell wall biosynthesis
LLWPVYVAGEEEHPDPEIEALAIGSYLERSLRGNVRKLGYLSQEALAEWLARAAIYVLPARYEPFGLSVLEAALSGCALVLGDIPSLQEIWGDAAVFVRSDDREALAAAINALITDSTRRCQLAKMARDRALKLTPQRMATSYLEAYQELIEHQIPVSP